MELEGIEQLGAVAPLVGGMEEATPGERPEVADLPLELEQLVLGKLADVGGRHPEELSDLMEEQRAGERPLALQPRIPILELDPPGRETLAWIPICGAGDAELPGGPRRGDAVADQPQRQEIDDPGGHLDDRRSVGPLLEAPHHSGPAAQGQQRAGEKVFPAIRRDPEADQLSADDVK